MSDRELPPGLRAQLDEVKVSILAEYLCARYELDQGEQLLQILFKDGRYERRLPRRRRKQAPGKPSSRSI